MDRGWKNGKCWVDHRAFIPTGKLQRTFLYRFPYFPEEQCITTKQNQIYREVLIDTFEETQLEQWQQTIHYAHTVYKSE